MRLATTFLFLIPLLAACGGGIEVVLKTPVQDKCASTGLNGCPELTQGVLLYVQGDEVKGKDMVTKGAAENAPAKVRKFARQIKQLKKIPGASPYVGKLVEIADVLIVASKQGKGAPGAPGAPGAGPDVDTDDDSDVLRPPPPPPPGPPPGYR